MDWSFFRKKKDPIDDPILLLVNFLEQYLDKEDINPVLKEEVNQFKTFKRKVRKDYLPLVYQKSENEIVRVKSNSLNREQLRNMVKTKFRPLLNDFRFKVIFVPVEERRTAVAKLYLIILLERLIDLFGSGENNMFHEVREWVINIPDTEINKSIRGFGISKVPVTENQILHDLSIISLKIFTDIKTNLGEKAAVTAYKNAFDYMFSNYSALMGFSVIYDILPHSLNFE